MSYENIMIPVISKCHFMTNTLKQQPNGNNYIIISALAWSWGFEIYPHILTKRTKLQHNLYNSTKPCSNYLELPRCFLLVHSKALTEVLSWLSMQPSSICYYTISFSLCLSNSTNNSNAHLAARGCWPQDNQLQLNYLQNKLHKQEAK